MKTARIFKSDVGVWADYSLSWYQNRGGWVVKTILTAVECRSLLFAGLYSLTEWVFFLSWQWWDRLSIMQQMTYGQVRMFKQHAWSTVNHNGACQGFHVFSVTMNRTVFAGGFALAVRALGQAQLGKAGKCKAMVA